MDMPIKIQSDLPARSILEKEHIFVMTERRAETQDIRPLKIGIVNLMPTKIATETQLLRLLGSTPLQVEVSLVRMQSHEARNVGTDHLDRFYITAADVFRQKFDGMIITGAPVEQIDFEDVDYWYELCGIMNYLRGNVFCTLYICWGAQAGLYYRYGIPKYPLGAKISGIYPHRRTTENEPLLRGLDDVFFAPHSRYTEVRHSDIAAQGGLSILAESEDAGVLLAKSADNREIFITGHLEYDTLTLAEEYHRDLAKGIKPAIPNHYFPGDDPRAAPLSTWRSVAHLFYSNWLNYYVYQETPYGFV
jgi:homoserine O-succinyltransferase